MFKRGAPGNTFATFHARDFGFVIDPKCVSILSAKPYNAILNLIADLGSLDPAIVIKIYYPSYLADPALLSLVQNMKPILIQVANPESLPPFSLDRSIPKEMYDKLTESTQESNKALALLSLADALQSEGIITQDEILLKARYSIYQHHRILIIPLDEFGDCVEVFAHGHSVFWSASKPERYLTMDVFYQVTHWKGARFFNWFNSFQTNITTQELKENLRNALLNRYPFILYSRDMIRFYQLQKDHFYRRGLIERYGLALGYYVTTFYLLLWGMLEQLTIIAKHSKNLAVDERDCGIRSRKFLDEFGLKEPALKTLIQGHPFNDWINIMADMRHTAAHRMIEIPAPLLTQTEESEKSEEEILQIIRKENAFMYSVLPAEIMKDLESQMVWHWRVSKMKVVLPSMVLIKGRIGEYMRDPVMSVDYDLERLNALIDAFLIKLFG